MSKFLVKHQKFIFYCTDSRAHVLRARIHKNWSVLIFILYNFSFWFITHSFSETLRNVFSGDCHRLHELHRTLQNFTCNHHITYLCTFRIAYEVCMNFTCNQSKNTFLKVSEKLCVIVQKLKLYKMKISTDQHIGILKKK